MVSKTKVELLLFASRSSLLCRLLRHKPATWLQSELKKDWDVSIRILLKSLALSMNCRKSCQILLILIAIPTDVQEQNRDLGPYFLIVDGENQKRSVVERIGIYQICLLRMFHPELWAGLPDLMRIDIGGRIVPIKGSVRSIDTKA